MKNVLIIILAAMGLSALWDGLTLKAGGTAEAAVTRYVMMSDYNDLDSANDRGVVVGKPADPIALTQSSGRCGWRNYEGGGGGSSDPNFNALNTYSTFAVLLSGNASKPGRFPRQVFWGQGANLNPGTKVTAITNIEAGETCTEVITGTTHTFKKYSTTSDDS